MQPLTIYSYPGSFRTNKALIAAQYYGINVKLAENFQMGVTNKTPEFLAKNPCGKVPVLETPEGCVYESHAIARMFARARPVGCNVFLYGRNDLESAQVDQWLDFISNEMDSHIMQWLGQIHGYVQFNPKFLQEAKKNLKTVLQIPEKHLLAHTFLVGERLTLADIALACELAGVFTEVYDEEARRSVPNLVRWFQTCINQPQFKAVMGDVVLCTVAKEPAKPAGKAKEPKEEKEGEEKKEKKPAQAPKPKEEKKKEEKPKKEAEEEEDEAPKEEKKKNPLDLLPPSPFSLEWWKRRFANAKPEDMPAVNAEFWAKYAEDGGKGFCLYFAEFKYADEYKTAIRILNLLGGFIQRLEPLNKYAFGVLDIYGDAPNYASQSVWLFRGTTIPFEMTDCPDFDTWAFTPVDPAKPEDRARVEDIFCCRGNFKGLPATDQKVMH